MSNQIRILHMRAKTPDHGIVINTCGSPHHRDIDAFCIGPVETPFGWAKIFENAWQFTKRYADQSYHDWHMWMLQGLNDPTPRRYPRGRGAKPMFAQWGDEQLGYIDARKRIYGPLYVNAIQNAPTVRHIRDLIERGETVWLRDFDGYDHDKMNMSLSDVLDNPRRKMGHAFFLKAVCLNDEMLKKLR